MQHALDRVPGWIWDWRRTGRIVLLLDFDGTLAPIVPRAEDAQLGPGVRVPLTALRDRSDVDVAIVSGRALADLKPRIGLERLLFAGNHGMEIEGPGISETAPEALLLRPSLESAMTASARRLEDVPGTWIEDKGLTLTIHYRQAGPDEEPRIRQIVTEAAAAHQGLRVTSGKMVFEVRPDVAYDKGTAVNFILRQLDPPPGAPILYLGDDTTDEDAFRAVQKRGDPPGEGVIVGDPPTAGSAATSYLRNVEEVGDLLSTLAIQEV